MQSLEIISVNLWQILISLCNLLLLFLMLKRFLYKPVQEVLAKRQALLDAQYENAANAERDALNRKAEWDAKMENAKAASDQILEEASRLASEQKEAAIRDAKEKAERILSQAEEDAEMTRKKAQAGIKEEIISVSTALSAKLIGREIKNEDHHALIDRFIDEIGDSHDGEQ